MSTNKRELLRHTVATLAYRAAKAVAHPPADFDQFRVNESTRTPGQILAHMGDLLDWALSIARGKQAWNNSTPLPWDEETLRFFTALESFDAYLTSDEELHGTEEKLFQGPIADALTHVGQITLLRRIAGGPIKGENYYRADIEAGRVGLDQSQPSAEFD